MGERVKQEYLELGDNLLLHKCSVCGRVIIDPKSIKAGIGPECLSKYVAHLQERIDHCFEIIDVQQKLVSKLIDEKHRVKKGSAYVG